MLPFGHLPHYSKSPKLTQLCYSNINSMQQHSQQMQVLQHLLLQLLVEQQVTPKLLSCLNKLCTAISVGQQHQTTSGQQAAAHVLHERCMALCKVLHALTQVVPGKRSRTGRLLFVQLQPIESAELMLW